MKQLLKKLTAAILALTCLPVTGVTVSAESETLSYWGNTTWDAFENGEFYDDHGLFSGKNGFLYLGSTGMYRVTPSENYLRFDLREPVDKDEAIKVGREIVEILDPYYPGVLEHYEEDVKNLSGIFRNVHWYDDAINFTSFESLWNSESLCTGFQLKTTRLASNASETEAAVLLAMAKRHLLSGFYGWIGKAYYERIYFETELLPGFESCVPLVDENGKAVYDNKRLIYKELELDCVQAYLDEAYPGYVFEEMDGGWKVPVIASDGTTQYVEDKVYQVIPTEEVNLKVALPLMVELHDRFGLSVPICFLDSAGGTAIGQIGHNALERAGDVTLDCEVDIMDVIALNKQLLGAATLCDTAAKNADVNASGTPDDTDSLSILKYVVELTDTLG